MDDLIKRREILFDPLHADRHQARSAAGLLNVLDGVHHAVPEHPTLLHVIYDLRWISLEIIETGLGEAGFHLDNSLMVRLKRALFHYTEETLRANHGCERGRGNCTQEVFVKQYTLRRHGCRDERPEHWRRYL